jgi:hypothetical protein
MNPIEIPPLTFSWTSEWLPRMRENHSRFMLVVMKDGPVAAAKTMGEWNAQLDTWLRTFDTRKRESVLDLLFAEHAMLFDLIDPGYPPFKPVHGGPQWGDFRQRFHEAFPLVLAVQRVGFDGADDLLQDWRSLEAFAERKQWLP